MNENTLEESWHIRLSRFSVFMYSSALIIITFFLLTVLIFTTPISRYLPGYGDSGNRNSIIQESMRVDSLLQQVEMQRNYMALIGGMINGKVKPDSIASLDKKGLKDEAQKLLQASEKERSFTENFEKEEKYNLQSIENKPNENVYVFFKPTRGVISSSFDISEEQYGIYMITAPNESVMSVLSGTVVNTAFTFDAGWIISIQHDDNYLSVYKNNTQLLKKTGDAVKAGECIALTGDKSGKKSGAQFYFELWKQGKPVNPEDFIIF